MSEEEKKDPGFTVSDRRRFSVAENGSAREQGKAEDEAKQPEAKGEAKAAQEEAKQSEAAKERPAELPPIDFSTFVVSLSSSALIHMGVVADPLTGESNKDLGIAKQTIDMLAMLQEKTRGNLTKEEEQLLESILYDLRMRYVAESK
jgi:hypothetical protein